ncbi:MAG: hypothetical protein MHMPM18_004301 [Marteilia pararefringens]
MKLLFLVCFTLQFSNGMSAGEAKCTEESPDGISLEWIPVKIEAFCVPGPCTIWPTSLPQKFTSDQVIPLGKTEAKFETIAVNIKIEIMTEQLGLEESDEYKGKKNLLKCSSRFKDGVGNLKLQDLQLICDQKYVLITDLQKEDDEITITKANKATKETCKTFDGIKENIYSLIKDPTVRENTKKSCDKACSSSLSTGAIVGIVIGCIAGVCLIGGIIFFVMKSK